MKPLQLRTDIERAEIDGYRLPLGLEPGRVAAPVQGYTVDYSAGEEDDPDTYSFHVVISHEKLDAILDRLFDLLPREVHGIVEIGSRDAYRSLDVYMGQEAIPLEEFREGWERFAPFLLEDGSIAVGANSEDPFIEVFLDQWKGVSVHVPLLMRDDVERVLQDFGLHEVPETWPEMEENEALAAMSPRAVLRIDDEYAPDLDEVLLQIRHAWNLELNVDPEQNVDEAGRELGATLWHAMVIVENVEDPESGAYGSVWATARSLADMEDLIDQAIAQQPQWRFAEIYTVDRVAYDERPDELADLPPRREGNVIHLVLFEPWGDDDGTDDPNAPVERGGGGASEERHDG